MNRDEGQYELSHVFDDLLRKSYGNLVASNKTVNKSCTQSSVTPLLVLKEKMAASHWTIHK